MGPKAKTVVLIDCGAKKNIERALYERGVNVITVPWNFDVVSAKFDRKIDGVVISNGPGDPKFAAHTIENIKKLLNSNIPILGVCLGNQLLALAAGGDTKKLKYGHQVSKPTCASSRTPQMLYYHPKPRI